MPLSSERIFIAGKGSGSEGEEKEEGLRKVEKARDVVEMIVEEGLEDTRVRRVGRNVPCFL